jgi:hypothetical protein
MDVAGLHDRWATRLNRDEAARYAGFRLDRDKRDYLAAHVLLKSQKPPDLAPWSLTHTDGLAAVAFSTARGKPVGVDAEPVSAVDRLETMREVLLSPEDDPAIGLVELWTAKEAYLKSIGEGFSTERGFGVLVLLDCAPLGRVDDWDMIAIRDARLGVRARAWSRRVGGHVVSVVGEGTDGGVPLLERVTLP